ncbi:CLI_3235 family bacteriocin precursor [Clostridium beijerinckii]|uniref:CLI_3235 family bacteriocin precursor n=1 Tax=Clostridium beijerinckii TaxID=1520 RepID=UPI0014942760|nr:CLI_3235 family bacteriocin precursor [Clostridium beijerinckii]NOW07168.1 putative bacteriocin precursor [Clostridium beijerinckii]NYC05058.1 putative bacteriocin precursor [Clostridium beijerinckii]
MRKLVRRNHDIIETIEAYLNYCDCSGIVECGCNESNIWHDVNNDRYNEVFYEVKED